MQWLYLLLGVFTFVELNCENLFDTQHDSLKQDMEYLPESYHHWNKSRYWNKLKLQIEDRWKSDKKIN